MNILVVNWQDRLNPQSGGAEIHLHEIFGRLVRRGHRVTLLVSGFGDAPQRLELDGMEVHRVGGRHTFSALAPGYYRKHLRNGGFDVLVEDLNKVPVFAPLWTPTPVLLLVHHLFGLTAFQEATPPFAAATWLLERPLPWVYRDVAVEAVSTSTRDDLIERGFNRNPIRVIENGVDLDFFVPAQVVERFAEPTVLYLGRVKKYKRIDLIMQAIAKLRTDGLDVRMITAGTGDASGDLITLAESLGIADLVDMRGFVSEEEKRDLLRRTWMHALTSPKEGWGISNLEAAACGTATIASDSAGLRDSVRNDETGFLVPHGDIEALASHIGRIAADPTLRDRLGKGALRFAQHFSWDRAAVDTERHLVEIVNPS